MRANQRIIREQSHRKGPREEDRLEIALRRLASWWLSEFRAILPSVLHNWFTGQFRKTLWLVPSEESLELRLIGPNLQTVYKEIISWDSYTSNKIMKIFRQLRLSHGTPLILGLSADSFFSRSFTIPTLAAPRLASLALQDIERRTPFRPNDIYFQNLAQQDATDHKKLRVHQMIIRRELVSLAIERLALKIENISFVAPLDAEFHIARAIPIGSASKSENVLAKKLLLGLIIAAPLLAGGALATNWWNKKTIIEELSAKLPALQAKAQLVRRELDHASQTQSMIKALLDRQAMPRTSQIWEEVSRMLPDDSWLTHLKVGGDRMSLSGLSANAAQMVELFGQSPLFRDVVLTAPITPDPVVYRENFSIAAKIIGRLD